VSEQGYPADRIDTSRPHPARMYDYWLGGHDNYEIDRDAAERILATSPGARDAVRANRAFLRRAVRVLVRDYGVRQILDYRSALDGATRRLTVSMTLDTIYGTTTIESSL